MYRKLIVLLDIKVKQYEQILLHIKNTYNIDIFIKLFDDFNKYTESDLIVSNKIINDFTICVDGSYINESKFIDIFFRYIDNYKLLKKNYEKFLSRPPLIFNKQEKIFIEEDILNEISKKTKILDIFKKNNIYKIIIKKTLKTTDLFFIWRKKNVLFEENFISFEE